MFSFREDVDTGPDQHLQEELEKYVNEETIKQTSHIIIITEKYILNYCSIFRAKQHITELEAKVTDLETQLVTR